MKIKLENKTIEISKLPLRKYAGLLKALQQLPKYLEQLTNTERSQIIGLLPALIAECMDDVIRIVMIATPLKEEEINELGLDELIDVLTAIFEVNNYAKVFEKIKKAMPQQTQINPVNG